MSFETTLNKAVEDFKAKFATQHREAMKHEFSKTYNELTELGIRAAEKVAMIKDAHKSLNEAEKVIGVELTPLPTLGTALDGYAVVVEHKAEPKPEPVETQGQRIPRWDVAKVRKAVREFEKVRNSKAESIKRARRTELARVMLEANANGMPWAVISRLAGRSTGWPHNFITDTRHKGLI